MKEWRLKRIGGMLRVGKARIQGLVSGGIRWPDEPHSYVIEDLEEQKTYHVPVHMRPTWADFLPPPPKLGYPIVG